MNSSAPISTWNHAVILWLYSNLGGMTGTWASLIVAATFSRPNHIPPVADLFSMVFIIGILAAAGSLVTIPIARYAIGWLLLIPRYWPRLAATTVAVTVLFF